MIVSNRKNIWSIDHPVFEEWVVSPDNIDEVWAFNSLNGLSKEDAIKIIQYNPSTYTEMLEYARESPFFFYLEILTEYLLSDESKENFGAASGFMELLLQKVKNDKNCFKGKEKQLFFVLSEVANRQKFYDADIEIFGNFFEYYKKIRHFLGAQEGP